MKDITYHVPEMHCGACEASIRKSLGAVDGVGEVEVDLERRRVRVHYDPDRTGVDAIRDRIESAGFDVG